MWISRKHYNDLLTANAGLSAQARTLADQNTTLRTSMEWFMVRTTQLEKERALLVQNYMGVTLETPDYRPQPTKAANQKVIDQDIPSLISAMSFADMGDAEASRQGIAWDDDGNVTQRKQE